MLVIENVVISAVCPGAEFTSGHVTLTRPNGQLVISRALEESDSIYVCFGIKKGGILEEDEFVEFRFDVKPSSGSEIDALVESFEQMAK